MGRRKKTLHDYAAEFSELSVKRQLLERGAGGEAAVVETLYCTSCQLPMRVRRDRILEHLSSGRHYRNRRQLRQHALRAPLLRSAGPDAGLPPLPAPPFVLAAGCGAGPSPPALPKAPVPPRPAAGAAVPGEDPTPSTSAGRPSPLAAFHPRLAPAPPALPGPRGAAPEAPGSAVGLALFGAGLATEGLCRSLLEEVACRLLYVVEDRPEEAERALGAELRAGTRLLRPPDADVALSDPRVSGAIVCSPPEEASEIVIGALRAGKAVFCERLPSLDRQTAEACFDEAERCGRPLVCGFYKRFDPALQFLQRKVRGSRALGRIHRVWAVSSASPAAPPGLLRAAGGIFYNAAVHDIDIISLLLGERTPDTVFSLGHAFCADLARVKDADTVAVSMKFPSGAVVTLDISQHCTKSCDQRLEVRGSEGTLRMDNRHPLGITEQGTSVPICSQTQADRYRDAHRELLRHFLRTLKGEEPPAVSREQVLSAMRVAAAAEWAWRSGRAVELRGGAEAP